MSNNKNSEIHRKFFIEEVQENDSVFKITDYVSGLIVHFKKINGTAVKDMSEEQMYCAAEAFSKIITEQLQFEKQNFLDIINEKRS